MKKLLVAMTILLLFGCNDWDEEEGKASEYILKSGVYFLNEEPDTVANATNIRITKYKIVEQSGTDYLEMQHQPFQKVFNNGAIEDYSTTIDTITTKDKYQKSKADATSSRVIARLGIQQYTLTVSESSSNISKIRDLNSNGQSSIAVDAMSNDFTVQNTLYNLTLTPTATNITDNINLNTVFAGKLTAEDVRYDFLSGCTSYQCISSTLDSNSIPYTTEIINGVSAAHLYGKPTLTLIWVKNEKGVNTPYFHEDKTSTIYTRAITKADTDRLLVEYYVNN